MARQLTFDLPARAALGREAFFVAPANASAVALVESWPAWPSGKLALVGPPGAGKTHLARVWAAMAGATVISAAELPTIDPGKFADRARLVIEDVPRIAGQRAAEAALLHLHNLVLAEGGALLVTGRSAPSRWPIRLADLASRLQGTAVARLAPPDDALIAAVLVKLFADRQLAVPPEVVAYLVVRIERSLASAERLVDALDRRALAERRAVTRPLAALVLDNLARGTA